MHKLWNWIKSFFIKEEPKIDHSSALEYMNKMASAKTKVQGMGTSLELEARRRFESRIADLKYKMKEEEELRKLEEQKEIKGT